MPNEQICEAIQVRLMAAHPCVIPNGLNFRGAQWLLAIGARLELAHVGGLALEPKWLIPCVDERVVAPSLGLRPQRAAAVTAAVAAVRAKGPPYPTRCAIGHRDSE